MGSPSQSTYTDSQGYFQFTGLAFGNYSVSVSTPPGMSPTGPQSTPVTLSATQPTVDVDAGFTAPAPSFMQTTNQTSREGDAVSLQVYASSGGGGSLNYALAGQPAGLTINPVTGLIGGTVAAGDASPTPYSITVTASNGTATGQETFSWTVNAGTTTGSGITINPIANQQNTEGDAVSLQVSATTSGTAPLTYSAVGLLNGLTINPTTGLIEGTLAAGTATQGMPRSVTVTATSGIFMASTTFFWAVAPPVAANPLIVTNLNDAGAGSLRAAITFANTQAGPSTITFAGAAARGTITLESALPDLETNVSIEGPGLARLTITRDAAAATNFSIFNVSQDVTASISGLSITGGANPTGSGGGIENEGDLTLTSDAIFENSAKFGGGIDNVGTIRLDNVGLSNNNAVAGGGLSNIGGTATLSYSTIQGNTASDFGGGIWNSEDATVDLCDSDITGNKASNRGGGVFNDGDLTMCAGSLSSNRTNDGGDGGGMMTGAVSLNAQVNLSYVSINNNSTGINGMGGIGGGIYFQDGSLDLNTCRMSGNQAIFADGIYVLIPDAFTQSNCTITDTIQE